MKYPFADLLRDDWQLLRQVRIKICAEAKIKITSAFALPIDDVPGLCDLQF